MAEASGSNVWVAVRLRPIFEDGNLLDTGVWKTEGNCISHNGVSRPGSNKASSSPRQFVYDSVFTGEDENRDVYDEIVAERIYSVIEGYNVTIFAYGQTASGKTHTMQGREEVDPGVIPLSIRDVFGYIQETPEREFLLRVSYCEIYNEVVNDLLNPEATNLKIRESKEKGIFVEGLKEEIVVEPDQVLELIHTGNRVRRVGRTKFNERSSRSHSIFSMVVESKVREEDGSAPGSATGVLVASLNLIDLAGSEKCADEEARRREGTYINRSLLTLGSVISALGEKDKKNSSSHVRYRDSKLTRILQDSLSGSAKICVICTISPTQKNFEESSNTLLFAQRTKLLRNDVRVNEVQDERALLRKYRKEIERLQRELEEKEQAAQVAVVEPAVDKSKLDDLQFEKDEAEAELEVMQQKLYEQEASRSALEEKLLRLSRLILVSTDSNSHDRRGSSRRSSEKSREGAGKPEQDKVGLGAVSRAHRASTTAIDIAKAILPNTDDILYGSTMHSLERLEFLSTKGRSGTGAARQGGTGESADNDAQTSLSRLNDEMKVKKKQLDATKEALELANETIASLKTSNSNRDEELMLLRDQNKSMNLRLRVTQNQVSDLEAEIASLRRGVAPDDVPRTGEAHAALMEVRRSIETADREVAEAAEVMEVKQKLAKLEEDKNKEIADLKLQLKVAQSDNAHLTSELTSKSKLCREYKETVEALDNINSGLEEENKHLRKTRPSAVSGADSPTVSGPRHHRTSSGHPVLDPSAQRKLIRSAAELGVSVASVKDELKKLHFESTTTPLTSKSNAWPEESF